MQTRILRRRAMLLCSAVTAAMLAGSLACNTEFQVPADPAKLAVIAGTIVDADGEGLPDARVSTLDGAGAATTDCDGFYSLLVPDRWSGSVQVDFTDARFSPLLRRHAYVKDVLWSEFRAPIAPIDRLNNCADKPPVATAPACHSDAECDDGKYCNGVEVCDSVRGCLRGVPVACDDGVACTADACNEAARACKHEFRDSACDDRLFCNGVESCTLSGCKSSGDPCGANQTCDESNDACTAGGNGTVLYVDDNGAQQPGYDAGAPFGSKNHPYVGIQDAVRVAQPGTTIIVRAGTYTSGSTSASTPIITVAEDGGGESGKPVTIKASDGERVLLDGKGVTRDLVIIKGKYIDLEGLELTGAQRTAVDISGTADTTHHVNVRRCYAHDNVADPTFIGGAFRTMGPVQYVTFEECISARNSNGFQLRESPTQTAGSASVPPKAGNTGFVNDLPEAEWDSWPGWTDFAARHCTIRRCIAFDNRLLDEHSDGIAARYAIDSVFEDNIAFGNADDDYDLLGATRCTVRGNIAFQANPGHTANGDGNGLKIGVRGGLDNMVYLNIAFDNPRAGIDLADTERAHAYHNTCFNNGWFGIWSEATRSTQSGLVAMNNLCYQNAKDIGASGRVALCDYNAVGDTNNHTGSIVLGSHSMKSVNPMFRNSSLAIDTNLPDSLTIAEKLSRLREQVSQKLGLAAGSPVANVGAVISEIHVPVSGSGPDLGAIESD